MKPLVVIPARGGSKGVPRKNIKLLGGKPLIQYTIEAAREVFPDEVICVSTDDIEIISVVEALGLKVPFQRPAELATDQAGSYGVLLHAVDYYEGTGYEPDTLVLLQPTSPFRKGKQILEAMLLFDDNTDMVLSVKESAANPYYNLLEENDEGWLIKSKEGNFTRRQDCPKIYEANGAIYIIKIDVLKNKPLIEFSKIRKYVSDHRSSIEIDTMGDWYYAEYVLQNK